MFVHAAALLVIAVTNADPKPLIDESFGPSEKAATYEFTLPKTAKRVELIVFADVDGKPRVFHLLPGKGSDIKINDKPVIEFLRKDAGGTNYYRDHVQGQEYSAKDRPEGVWMDVSPVCQSGKNSITYYHTSPIKHGVRIRAWRK